MRHTRTVQIAGLNIAMHAPHSADRYVALIRRAARRRMAVKFGAVHVIRLGSLSNPELESGRRVMVGEIFRFVKLDRDEPWFNEETYDAATQEEIEEVSLPSHLLPHLQRIKFIFLPDTHALWFIRRDRKDGIGASVAERFFEVILRDAAERLNLPTVEVTLLADHDNLDRLLSLPRLDRITIELKRPNPDDADDDEQRWMERLQHQHAQKIVQTIVAVKHESIQPDSETRILARVAADNGSVHVVGKDGSGARIDESTKDSPMNVNVQVNDNLETAAHVLRRVALEH
jgi:hypothetical protein